MSKIDELFGQDLRVINLGLKSFADDLKSQNIQVIHVDWRPAAGGNAKMMAILNRLKSKA